MSDFNAELSDLSIRELKDLTIECATDSRLAAQVLFPEQFFAPFESVHDDIFYLLDKSDAKKKLIAAPRGVGKSIIANLVCKMDILYHRKHFIGYLSDSLTKAEMETESIKGSLTSGDVARQIFPSIKTSYYDNDDSFSKKSWVAYGQTFVMPRGAGQQVNGLRWQHFRPDRWIIDDLENVEEVMNEIQRKKLKTWFYKALMPTVSRYDKDYSFIYIDTIKHQDALIVDLLEDPEWESIQLSICNDDYKTLMPNFFTQDELDKEVETHRQKKMMDIFAMNFMSMAVAPEDLSFKDVIQYYSETDKDFKEREKHLVNIVIVDPAKTAKMHNAQSGFVVWGVDLDRGRYHVRYAAGDFLHPDEVINRALHLAEQYNAHAIGMEVTGLEEWGTYTFKNTMLSRSKGRIFHFEELKAKGGKGELGGVDGSKIGRVNYGILPLYRQGLIYHNKVGTSQLEAQLLSFPRPKRWDVLDAAAYLPKMLQKVLMYISPEDADDHFNERPEDIEREYEGLYDEPALKRNDVGYYSI